MATEPDYSAGANREPGLIPALMGYSAASLEACFKKYETSPYMLSKIHHIMCNQLPTMLENIDKTYNERQRRLAGLANDQDFFIDSFIANNKYFYVSSTENFFYYDGVNYFLCNEDDILHKVLSTISKDRTLLNWKKKTKILAMKRIRENNILTSVPESCTIQFVLDLLYPAFFSSKFEAKYFLTVIGDNIHKKNQTLNHFMQPYAKRFVQTLSQYCAFYFGLNMHNTIKYKFYEHEYASSRLIKINDAIKMDDLWEKTVAKYALDILCVASHYSVRYSSSDEYLANCDDYVIHSNILFLKDKTPEIILQMFLKEYVQIPQSSAPSGECPSISWKNMQYLWKHYLETNFLPCVIFQSNLKSGLVKLLGAHYNEDQDSFQGLFSRHLPAIQTFLKFWEETIAIDESESDFEIEELSLLLKKWCNSQPSMAQPAALGASAATNARTLSEKSILHVISYYFSNVEIEQDKYIHKISCKLWDKQIHVQIALSALKDEIRAKSSPPSETADAPAPNVCISIYDAYVFYCKYYSSAPASAELADSPQNWLKTPLVSKNYFEKYVIDNLGEHAIDDAWISYRWITDAAA
jgi:hypothetical protein